MGVSNDLFEQVYELVWKISDELAEVRKASIRDEVDPVDLEKALEHLKKRRVV